MQDEIKSNKLLIYIIPMIILILVLGVSYAVWRVTREQSNPNIVSTMNCLNVTLTDVTSAINLTNEYPISNEEGMTKNPYTFKITNNCEGYIKTDITLEVLSSATLEHQYVRASLNKLGNKINNSKKLSGIAPDHLLGEATISGATSYILLKDVIIAPLEEKEYDLRLWVDKDTTNAQGKDKTFQAKVVIIARPTNDTNNSLANQILEDNGGASVIENKSTPNYTNLAVESGMFPTQDDYGTSYYFLGSHEQVNNWVEFAGYYWRIIRIDGNGDIRMIYNGVANGSPQYTGDDTQIAGTHCFSYNCLNNDNAYVGFKYGTPGSSTYAATHTGDNPSNAYTIVTNWYNTNLASQGANITDKIKQDAVYCGDRNLKSGSGYGTVATNYKATERAESLVATLNCQNTQGSVPANNDQYELAAGLIAFDELVFSMFLDQIVQSGDFNQWWLYTSNNYWTMTPASFSSAAKMLTLENTNVSYSEGIRPVITLKSNTIFDDGNGTLAEPYNI